VLALSDWQINKKAAPPFGSGSTGPKSCIAETDVGSIHPRSASA
jgi:hypothetical protein